MKKIIVKILDWILDWILERINDGLFYQNKYES